MRGHLTDGWALELSTPYASALIAFGMWARIFLWLGFAVFMFYVAPIWGALILAATLLWNLFVLLHIRRCLLNPPLRAFDDDSDEPQGGISESAGKPVRPKVPPSVRKASVALDWPK